MTSIVNPLAHTAPVAPAPSSGTANDPASKLANEQTFLQLLVAQIQNQDPLNPTDSIQFVTQLAQFTQVEQTLAVRQDADGILKQVTQIAAQTSPAPPPAPTPADSQN